MARNIYCQEASYINSLIHHEIEEVAEAIRQQAGQLFDAARSVLRAGVKPDEVAEKRLQGRREALVEVERRKMEALAAYESEKATIEVEIQDLQKRVMGPLMEKPSDEALLEIGAKVGTRDFKRGVDIPGVWHGLEIHTQLDLLAAKELAKVTDVTEPLRLLQEIRESVEREASACLSAADARKLHERFRKLGLDRLGQNAVRSIEEIAKDARLSALAIPKALPPGKVKKGKSAKSVKAKEK